MFKDCDDHEVRINDRVGVAFSYSRASVGYIRLGTVVELEPNFHVRWEKDGKVSPPMVYNPVRVVVLNP